MQFRSCARDRARYVISTIFIGQSRNVFVLLRDQRARGATATENGGALHVARGRQAPRGEIFDNRIIRYGRAADAKREQRESLGGRGRNCALVQEKRVSNAMAPDDRADSTDWPKRWTGRDLCDRSRVARLAGAPSARRWRSAGQAQAGALEARAKRGPSAGQALAGARAGALGSSFASRRAPRAGDRR